MVGTWRRTEHRTGKNPIEFVNYIESEQRSNMRRFVETFNPNENLLEQILSSENMRLASAMVLERENQLIRQFISFESIFEMDIE